MSVNFMDIDPKEAHRELYMANRELVGNFFSKKQNSSITAAQKLYLEGDTSFRGFRPV
jgi:hypothetical protein